MSGITIAKAENVLVRIEATDGNVGWGEAASAPTMTGDTLGGLVAAVRDHLAPMLIGQDAFAHIALVSALRRALVGNTGAHSAVEMALLDLIGRVKASGSSTLSRISGAGPCNRCGCSGNATSDQDIAEARAKAARGLPFLQAQDRRETAHR